VLIEAINSAIGVKGSGKTSGLWTEVKADYLKRVEQALSAARHPKSFEILAEVGNHLDRRFAELAPQQRTWENFQRIITEMGPPSEYAELVGSAEKNIKTGLSIEYRTIFVLVLAVVAAGMIILPKVLNQQKISEIQWTIENDPELVGKWVSVDFVKEPNDFSLIEKRWPGDLYVKDIAFNSDRTTTIGWSWTKGWIIDWSWTKGWIIDNGSGIKAEYEIRNIGGVKYLFLPWLNGDVIIRHQKPQYYVLKKVTETAQKAQNENNQATESAVEAAKAWLQLVDDGQYGQSWSQAAEYFKKFINEEQWKTSVEPVRRPLGRVLSRKVLSSTYTTTVPGAPDGQYVVIQFETSFENKQNAVETVTPMMEPNAQWRVSGYYIK
jgi:hypothetical protein